MQLSNRVVPFSILTRLCLFRNFTHSVQSGCPVGGLAAQQRGKSLSRRPHCIGAPLGSQDRRAHYSHVWSNRARGDGAPRDDAQLLAHATPLFEPQPARGATDQRRFFEETALPANLVVLGDAVG